MIPGQPDPRSMALLQLLQQQPQRQTAPLSMGQDAAPQTPGILGALHNGAFAMPGMGFGGSQRQPSMLESMSGNGGMGGMLGALRGMGGGNPLGMLGGPTPGNPQGFTFGGGPVSGTMDPAGQASQASFFGSTGSGVDESLPLLSSGGADAGALGGGGFDLASLFGLFGGGGGAAAGGAAGGAEIADLLPLLLLA